MDTTTVLLVPSGFSLLVSYPASEVSGHAPSSTPSPPSHVRTLKESPTGITNILPSRDLPVWLDADYGAHCALYELVRHDHDQQPLGNEALLCPS